MKIDTLPFLLNTENIAFVLGDKQRKLLQSLITKKFGNIKNFSMTQKLNYDTAERWLSLSKIRRREPPCLFVSKTCALLGIKMGNIVESKIKVRTGRHFQSLPRSICIDNDFFEGYGIYVGEGATASHLNEIAISNTNIDLLRMFLKWLKCIGVNKDDIKVHVYVPNLDFNKTELVNKICIELRLNKKCMRSFYVHKKSSLVCFLLILNNAALKYLIDAMEKKFQDVILSRQSYTGAFLRGYLAAEGYVYIPKKGKGCFLEIAFGKIKEFNFVKECFKKLGIEFRESMYLNKYPRVRIYKEENLKKIYNFGGFGHNQKRQERLSRALIIQKGGEPCQKKDVTEKARRADLSKPCS